MLFQVYTSHIYIYIHTRQQTCSELNRSVNLLKYKKEVLEILKAYFSPARQIFKPKFKMEHSMIETKPTDLSWLDKIAIDSTF